MLISPPFILTPTPGESDQAFVMRCMVVGDLGRGGYPVSFEVNWHNGVHLTAPAADGGVASVRAIADGVAVYVRQPTAQVADPAHPLNYLGGWTDDGCVILRHRTEIGAAGAAATTVVFFSICMHLQSVDAGVVQGHRVFRKQVLGAAGRIYGTQNLIHHEIICDDANVRGLTGRATPDLNVTHDGRTDALFGAVYFLLPAGTQFQPNDPNGPPPGAGQAAPAAPHPTTTPLVLVMRFVQGTCTMQTFQMDGTPGTGHLEADQEYTLLATARRLYPQGQSAGFELLRFGRVVGPDALNPPAAPSWRKMDIPGGGSGWVNVNAPGVFKFSDADFPGWDNGWRLVDATASADSRCREQSILRLLDINHDALVRLPQEAQQALSDPSVQWPLSHKICKVRTEWDDSTIDTRWLWLVAERRMDAPSYARYKAHLTALSFWRQANLGLDGTHWHFHPREFIRQFRQCGWLSADELAQCIPRRDLHLVGTAFQRQAVAPWNTALARATTWKAALDVTARKYLICATPQRLVHFLAQVVEESGFLQLVIEGGGAQAPYAPYYGRGPIQLTHLGNYQTYGNYRGFLQSHPDNTAPFTNLGWNPDALIASTNAAFDADNCADTAGFYWASHRGLATSDAGLTVDNVVAVSRLVNGDVAVPRLNGLDIRQENVVFMKYVLTDLLPPGNTEQLRFAWRQATATAGHPADFTLAFHDIAVPLDPQRPAP